MPNTTNTKRCCKIARLTGTTGESSCLHEGRPRVNPSRWPHQHRLPPSCLLLLSEQHQHRRHDVERVGGAGASLRSERHRVGDRQRPASRSEPTASFVLSHPTTLARAPQLRSHGKTRHAGRTHARTFTVRCAYPSLVGCFRPPSFLFVFRGGPTCYWVFPFAFTLPTLFTTEP